MVFKASQKRGKEMRLLKTADVSEMLNLAEITIRKKVSAKEIPFIKIGKAVRYDEDRILKWIEKKSVKTLR